MKQISYAFPRQGLRLEEVPEKNISKSREVKIKVEYASICGSDVHQVKGHFDGLLSLMGFPEGQTIGLGHEVSGTVVEVGSEVNSCKVGDHVTCNCSKGCGTCYHCRNGHENECMNPYQNIGAMSEYIVMDESNVFVVPDHLSLRQACITEPTSIAMTTIDEARIEPGQSVAIIGGGPIGMLVLQLAKMQGASVITLFDIVEEKFEMAKNLGADYAIDSRDPDAVEKAKAYTNGIGYDRVIECSGSEKVVGMATELLCKCGRLVLTSAYSVGTKIEFDAGIFVSNCLSVSSVWISTTEQFNRSLRLLHKIDFDKTITAEYTMDQYEEAFEAASNGKNVKVIIKIAE